MPELTGPEMAAEIFRRDAGYELTPIVLASGATDPARNTTIVETPYVLTKPFTVDQLVVTLDRALAERKSPQPRQS